MKNFEYWIEEILQIEDFENLALKNGKPVECDGMRCTDCDFKNKIQPCNQTKKEWLYEEHVEQPTLTKKERMFCELVETGWIARDKDGKLFWYHEKPEKMGDGMVDAWITDIRERVCSVTRLQEQLRFGFIRWEDSEPWSVEELLKLEVKE